MSFNNKCKADEVEPENFSLGYWDVSCQRKFQVQEGSVKREVFFNMQEDTEEEF